MLDLSLRNTNFTIYQKKVGYDSVVVFQKVVQKVEHVEPDSTLLVTQKYIDCNNDTEMHGNKKVARYVSANEFLPHQPYLCKVFITNMSAVEANVPILFFPKNQIQSERSSLEMDGSLTINVKDEKVQMVTRNISAVTVNLYELNVESMFSKSPFLRTSGSTSLSIRPNYSEQVTLTTDASITTTQYLIPEAYRTKNVLVEVTADRLRETAFAFNTRLLVLISSETGQLRVYDKETQKPLSSCYVKVYAKTGSGTEFLKDGYTDIRGYFDYYSVSTDVATNLSIFIDEEGCGSCIRETDPPVSAR